MYCYIQTMDLYGLELLLLVAAVAGLVWLVVASRPADERRLTRFAALHRLALTDANRQVVASYLRRARVLRTLGAWLGIVVPMLVTALTRNRFPVGGWEVALLGYLVGAAIAEVLVPRPVSAGSRRAALAPRRLTSYLPGWTSPTRWVLVLMAGGLAGWYAAAWQPGAPQARFGGAVAGFVFCAAVAVGSELLVRAVVRRRQPVVGADLLAADDAIRSSSLHALAAAATASQVLLISTQLSDLGRLAQAGGGSAWTFDLVSFVVLALAVTAWSALRQPAPATARLASA